MQLNILFFVFLFCFGIARAHIDPIPLSEGTISFNQEIKSNFSFDFIFRGTNNIQIQDIGIGFFNVGDDDSSTIFLKIVESNNNKVIAFADTILRKVYNQMVYVDLPIMLNPNIKYSLVFGSSDSTNDDIIHLFKPKSLPYKNQTFPVEVFQLYQDKSQFPVTISEVTPYFSFGIGSQLGIDFIAGQQIIKYPSNYNAKVFSSIFTNAQSDLVISKIGLDYLDVGEDNKANFNFFLKDVTNEEIIFSKDTLFVDLHKKNVDINLNVNLKVNNKYEIGIRNLNSNDTNNLILAYKVNSMPYVDNLNLIQIEDFLVDNRSDSLGLAYYLIYEQKKSSLQELDIIPYTLINNNEQFIISIDPKNIREYYYLFDGLGRNIAKYKSIDNKIVVSKTELSSNSIHYLVDDAERIRIKLQD